jgi:hypothetical protein
VRIAEAGKETVRKDIPEHDEKIGADGCPANAELLHP